jgi:hypothetical protein
LPKKKILEEMWATHQLLLNLGFKADDIYVYDKCLAPYGEECIGVVLRDQDLQWVGYFGTPDDDSDTMVFLQGDWPEFVAHMKTISTEKQEYVYKKSLAWTRMGEMIASLLAKGFVMPYENQKLN